MSDTNCVSEHISSHNQDETTLEAFTDCGFEAHPDILMLLRRHLRGGLSTQIVEDGFNLAKNAKLLKAKKRFRKPEKAMGVMLSRGLVGRVHDFSAVPSDEGLQRQCARLPAAAFQPDNKGASFDFKGVCGTASSPSLYSAGVEAWCAPYAGLFMIEEAHRRQDWSILSSAWLGRLLQGKHKVMFEVRNEGWFLALHSWADSCVVAWPVRRFWIDGYPASFYFELAFDGAVPRILPITTLDGLSACSFSWRSPAYQLKHFPKFFKAWPLAVRVV